MTANLPKQKHPFDESGKIYVNKEWYLALLGLVNQANGGGGTVSVADVQLLEAIDAQGSQQQIVERSLADILVLALALSPQESVKRINRRLRDLEIQFALVSDVQGNRSSVGAFVDEFGSGGTPGFAAGVDFTAGTTTTLLLSQNYGSAANLWINFDGTPQGRDQFSLTGRTLSFTSPIPVGTSKVFVKGAL